MPQARRSPSVLVDSPDRPESTPCADPSTAIRPGARRAAAGRPRLRRVGRTLIERRLRDVSDRLKAVARDLAVADEQLAHLADEADEARLRALVSETPLAEQEHHEAERHADAMRRHRADLARRDPPARTRPRRAARPARRHHLTPRTHWSATVPTRVVIAEDEAIIRLDLKETLEEEGYEVVGETGRGDEAVELVREHKPDVAILDIKMPGLDGLSAAREIAGERRAAVLILTAFSQRDLIEQARDAGALAYLVKPFQKADLFPAIEVALGRFQELKALHDQATSLEEQLETRKVVDRAKGQLMDQHGLTEAAAFAFIQKTAMRERQTMKAVAQRVLDGDLAPA